MGLLGYSGVREGLFWTLTSTAMPCLILKLPHSLPRRCSHISAPCSLGAYHAFAPIAVLHSQLTRTMDATIRALRLSEKAADVIPIPYLGPAISVVLHIAEVSEVRPTIVKANILCKVL